MSDCDERAQKYQNDSRPTDELIRLRLIDICRVDAPSTFKRNEESGYSMVFHQPETEAERQMAEDALTGCPVDAIGNDGAGG